MQCNNCNSNCNQQDKFCQNCGVCLNPTEPKHAKLIIGTALFFGLLTGAGVFGLLYILYSVLVWNIFT